ncbi:MAG: efflux RND transporter periplasmic adaptor subunit [Candidatus Eisenbacteria bacterium]|nr:efflux RND transporter periplasmic adaptor subunit [Candidatus Eisenbacteria bacterium]
MRDAFHAVGTIESDQSVEVASQIAGVVESLALPEGRAVGQGVLLARLDDRELKAQSERAMAQRELAAANFDRAKKLAEQQAISTRELDDARATLAVAEANASLAKVQLDRTRILAPFSGVVGRRRISVGAWLKPGDAVTEMAQLSPLRASFSAPERMLSELTPWRAVEIRTPAWPGRTFQGALSVVDPIVDPVTRTVRLLARLPNPAGLLRPGMSADVTVTLAERTHALTIPDEAVFAEGSASFVYVVKPDSSVTRATIQIGSRDSMRVEVLRGLSEGQTVVRTGHQKLFEGARVMPIPDAAAAEAPAPAKSSGRP